MKRIISVVMCVMLLLASMCISTLASGEAIAILEVSSATCKQGEQVNLDVNLKSNPGIMFLRLTPICYDAGGNQKSDLKVSVENGQLFALTEGKNSVWDSNSDVTDNGLLCQLKVDVSETVAVGTYTVSFVSRDCYDSQEQDVKLEIVAGTITVEARPIAVTGVTLNIETVSLATGASETLSATVEPSNATNKEVIWTSSDPSVATVDGNGKVEALKRGTTTIKAETRDGGFTDTCVVTVACSHSNTTTTPADPSTCEKQGNGDYVTCNDCNIVISGSSEKLPFASHKLTNHVAVPADHEKGGNIEYWTCDVCDKYFEDVNGTREITEADTKTNKIPHSHSLAYSYTGENHWRECGCGNKIEVGGHTYDNACDTKCNVCDYTRAIIHDYSTKWLADKTNHWHGCTVCGDKADMATHTNVEVVKDEYLKSEATCVAKAVYYKSCSDCGTVSEDTFENGDIDADNHGDTEVRNVESATCTKDGYTGDVYCKDCDEMVTEGEIIPAGHDYGTAYATDSENHWKECGCGNVIEKEAHSMGEWQTGKEKKERSCSVCGYKEIQELPTDTTDSESPKTGDSSHVYIWYILLVLSCMGVVSVFIRKKQS